MVWSVLGYSKKEEQISNIYNTSETYQESLTYSPQYTITYNPQVVLNSPESSLYSEIPATTYSTPFTTLTAEPQNTATPQLLSSEKKSGTNMTLVLIIAASVYIAFMFLTKKK